jgi:type VI secretion system protein ImpA
VTPNPFISLAAPLSDASPSGPQPSAVSIDHPIHARQVTIEQLLDDLEVRVRAWPPADFGHATIDESRDWASISQLCTAGLGVCRHLRLAAYLCLSEVEQRGLPGLRDGLELLAELTDTRWRDVHPGPPETGGALVRRQRTLGAVGAREVASANSDGLFVRLLAKSFESSTSPARLIDVSIGYLGWPAPTWVPEPDRPKEIEAAKRRVVELRTVDPEGNQRSIESLAACIVAVDRIKACYAREQVDSERIPNMSPLRELLEKALAVLSGKLEAKPGEQPAVQPGSPATVHQTGGGDWRTMSISSVDEVRLALQKAIRYLETNSSNPAPLFVEAGLNVIEKPYAWLLDKVPKEVVDKLQAVRDADKPAPPESKP